VRIERFLAAGAPIKGAARKFDIDYHALRRHWTNHVRSASIPPADIACIRRDPKGPLWHWLDSFKSTAKRGAVYPLFGPYCEYH
jgi:hypothetical protein